MYFVLLTLPRPIPNIAGRRLVVKEVNHDGRTHASRRRTSRQSRRRRCVRKNLLRRFHNPREQAQVLARFPSAGDSCTRALDNVFATVVLVQWLNRTGKIIGSNCFDERTPIAGVGPIIVRTGDGSLVRRITVGNVGPRSTVRSAQRIPLGRRVDLSTV